MTHTLPLTSHLAWRHVIAVLLGTLITFALFVVMAKLIAHDQVRLQQPPVQIVPDFVLQLDEEKVIPKAPPAPRSKPTTPPPPAQIPADPVTLSPGNDALLTDDFGLEPVTLSHDVSLNQRDQEARPVVQTEPRYPVEAARDGIEGWVSLSFTIDPVGGVTAIRIIDAEPARVFNRAARQALARWKYRPKIIDGEAVSQPDMRVVLEFTLSQ